jgi:NAD(P)-dependent dehydrogenase (short-subunit alcohol dehydrogenase family)
MAAQLLIEQGHRVVLHARNAKRAKEVLAVVPGAETAVLGDLSSIVETRSVAEQVNRLGPFDAFIHNAAVGYREKKRIKTQDGLPHIFPDEHLGAVHRDGADPSTEAGCLPQLRDCTGR